MAKISELSDGGSLLPTDYLIAVRSGGNVKVQADTINVDQIDLGDNEKIRLGASQDLQIYHDASDSIILDNGTGNLKIQANDLVLKNADGSKEYLKGTNGGSVRVRHNNTTVLETTSTGIDVTGTVTLDDTLNISGGSTTAFVQASGSLFQIGASTASSLVAYTNNAERMRIDSSGNVGIGTTSPDAALDVLGSSGDQLRLRTAETEEYRIGRNASTGLLDFYGSQTGFTGYTFGGVDGERMRIDSSGNLLVSDTTANPSGDNVDSGIALHNAGLVRASTNNAAAPLDLNVKSRDGDIATFKKDGVTVGSIGTAVGYLTAGTGDTGLLFNSADDAVQPWNISTNSARDASIDIGRSTHRFKDLFLSSAVRWYSGATQKAYMQYDGTDVVHYGASGVGHQFWSGGSRSVDIDSSGNLLVGKTNLAGNFYDSSGVAIRGESGNLGLIQQAKNATSGTLTAFYSSSANAGNITLTSATTVNYGSSSDYRLKENVVAMSGATERLKQLKPSRFNFIADPDTTVDGFLAHEVQDIVPEAITGTKDAVDAEGNPEYQNIDQSKLVPLLVATIQELEARIAQLEGAN